ncbi:hypothetical protein AVMA1855_02795 [Acidovorax sp. SUPP1855]|uniref:hypothetical protein n=1 Tax=unclassified Acidovorax TaxID=2684926 RepID=UPI0023DE1A84|nr:MULTISPECIES: hypothetical protein [unclassified Acidovorax]GKS83033.1 hypothetical protein AVMA1855_02795 [Acidovorax sp. SUPP1855]GKT02291.1 hypothetical protein AVKW3434_22900 [Acidovorax sp. SUPP3434]
MSDNARYLVQLHSIHDRLRKQRRTLNNQAQLDRLDELMRHTAIHIISWATWDGAGVP